MLLLAAVQSPSYVGAPARVRAPAPRMAASATIETCKGDDASLAAAAAFFVDGFWASGTTTSALELSEAERLQLCKQQTDDMVGRYGDLVGSRRLKSSLFLARDGDGAIAGCVGVEMALVEPSAGKVLSRSAGEGLLTQELSSMGARERNQYRKMGAAELTANLFPEYQVYALLANLAVGPSLRGQGMGKQLCEACEEAGRNWEVPAIMLQVEEANAPARKLYQSVGYADIHTNEIATALRVQPGAGATDGLLTSEKSTLILMGKGLA
jgi:ribosomal protein S18 acetylase RimI-like enzyme